MSSKLTELVLGLGNQLFQRVLGSLEDDWGDLRDSDKLEVRSVLDDSAELMFRSLAGEDVETEAALVKSTIADWAWIGASKARLAVKAALQEAGAFAVGFIGKLF